MVAASSTILEADELPKELLLQCAVTAKGMLTAPGTKPDFLEDKYTMTLRLKDGSIGNIEQSWLEGKNCVLVDGNIRCELTATRYYKESNSTIKEHRTASINRATGEMHLFAEAWNYDGTQATGTPASTSKLIRTGVCHPATTKPLF
jgi:hypothetical protein